MHDLFIPFFIDNLLKRFTIVLVIQWHIIIYILFYKKNQTIWFPVFIFQMIYNSRTLEQAKQWHKMESPFFIATRNISPQIN